MKDSLVTMISQDLINKILAELQALPHGKVAGICKALNEAQHQTWIHEGKFVYKQGEVIERWKEPSGS